MRRNATTRAISAILAACATTSARADDIPLPLDPPAGLAPAAPPATPTPIPGPTRTRPADAPPPPREGRAVLALPGITTPPLRGPRPVPVRSDVSLPPSLASSPDGGLPTLEMPGARGTSPGQALQPLPSDRFRTRVVESTPAESILAPIDVPAPRSRSTTALPRTRVVPGPSTSGDADGLPPLEPIDEAEPKDRARDDEPTPGPAPRRPGLLGGRFFPRGGAGAVSDSAIRAEPRTDPAADAAIKRRIERQAREAVGDRARSIDVRVVGRSVTISAHGTRLLQRRALRRSLESLPGLSGYRSVVEVND